MRVLLALATFPLLIGCGPSSPNTSAAAQSATTVPAAPAVIPTTAASEISGSLGGMRTGDVHRSLLVGTFVICADCHGLLDRSASANPALVKAFAHALHLAQGAKCDDCHLVPTHTTTGIRKPDMVKCFGCHSLSGPPKPSGTCSTCHPPDFSLKPTSHEDSTWLPAAERLVSTRASHPRAAKESPEECRVCHAQTFCRDCHGVNMPHPAGWQNVHTEQAQTVGGQVCMKCHPNNESCSACHHPGYKPGGSPWWQIHPAAVKRNGATFCLKCHSTLTCAHCHTTGEYKVF